MEQSTGYSLLKTWAAFGARLGAEGGTSARLAFESALCWKQWLCVQVYERDKEELRCPGFSPDHSTLPSNVM